MASLAERLAQGSESAFAELYDACADRLHHYLVLRLHSRTDADDVLQETFLRLARNRTSLAKVGNLTAFLFAIARNEALRWQERKAKSSAKEESLEVGTLFCEASSEELVLRENAQWIGKMLLQLEPELREVVELKSFANLTLREIGEVLNLPQGTVATRYRRALDNLRSMLSKERASWMN